MKKKKLAFTKSQRHQIYKKALTELDSCHMGCICWAIMSVIAGGENELRKGLLNDFPEILRHEPKNIEEGDIWFAPYYQPPREKILRRAIKETAPKKQNQ